jgi:hypothetical protein
MRKLLSFALGLGLVAAFLIPGGFALAAPLWGMTNEGFETGDFTGWAVDTGVYGGASVTTFFEGEYSYYPYCSGYYFAVLRNGAQGEDTTISQDFTISEGETIEGFAFFLTHESFQSPVFNDNGSVDIMDGDALVQRVFYADTYDPNHPATPWTYWSWTATSSGNYTLLARVVNMGDDDFSSYIGLDICGEQLEVLEVTKTAVTSYNRTHEWEIEKRVETQYGNTTEIEGVEYPKIWLYQDGSGDECATWSVNVTYDGYVDWGFNIAGNITIYNSGDVAANITDVEDLLCGNITVPIDWPAGTEFPYLLGANATLTGTYSMNVSGKLMNCSNNVAVTTESDVYRASALILWGDPVTDVNKTVTIEDDSDLFGEVGLGNVTAPNGDVFTYGECFAWGNYTAPGPYIYDNTANIVGTPQSASARLVVNREPGLHPVGGTAYPVNMVSILAPWLVLAVVVAAGGCYLVRRRHNNST